jgi:TonB-dependent starch-binding outer membrane protein SusC
VVQRTWIISVALSLSVGVAAALAQQRPISGKVYSTTTSEPIASATVSVVGSPVAAVTNGRGEFSLSAPPGALTLQVRSVGFRHRQVAVAADQTSVDVGLEQDVFNLEAVVVTGQATAVEQRNLANAVTTVNAEQLNRAPTPTLESALQGKVPGALIQLNSGAPGGGGQIQLRGVTTINAGVDPLIVVDGLIVSNDAIPNGMNAITAAQAGGNPRNQDNPVNRLADLNPADIDNVAVLKGASAAAIYGSLAANGVVIITTRHGQPGKPRFTLAQRFGTFSVSNTLGSRVFKDSIEAKAAFGKNAPQFCTLPGGACPAFDNEGVLFGEHQLSWETDGSVSGGTEDTRYFFSGLVKRDGGIAKNTGYDKQSLRANIDQKLGDRWQLSINSDVVHSKSARGISNNDNTGTSPYLVFPFTPNFINLQPKGPDTLASSYPVNLFSPSNPLQTFALLKNDEDLWRILGTSRLTFDAITTEHHHLVLSATGGADFFQQRNDILSPPDLQFEPADGQPGTVVLGKAQSLRLNLLGTAVHTYTPASGNFLATTSLGFQYEDRSLNLTSILGRTLLQGQQNVSQATSISTTQSEQPVRNLGLFAQEEFLTLGQRLLLTAGVRADRSSVNGNTDKFFIFPKGAASYRFAQPFGGVDELKLRVAVGQTGNPPTFGSKFQSDTTGTIQGNFGVITNIRAGDPTITPERNTEIEGGVDATLGHEFATVNLTVYQKTITDLLLEQTLASSTGHETRVLNGGELRNRGVEAAVGISPVRRPDFSWLARVTFSLNRSKIVTLPVPTFQTGGFGTSLGAFQIQQGRSATQIVGLDSTGKVVVVGDAAPDFQMYFSSDLNYKQFSLGFLWDWKHGGSIINLTQLLYDFGANSADWNSGGSQRFASFSRGNTQPYVQDGSYLKLREVTLSYNLPTSVTEHLFGGGVRSARLSASGRNLLRFTPYVGLDPEVSNFGNQAIIRNIDVAPFPPSRSFFFSIDLGF